MAIFRAGEPHAKFSRWRHKRRIFSPCSRLKFRRALFRSPIRTGEKEMLAGEVWARGANEETRDLHIYYRLRSACTPSIFISGECSAAAIFSPRETLRSAKFFIPFARSPSPSRSPHRGIVFLGVVFEQSTNFHCSVRFFPVHLLT